MRFVAGADYKPNWRPPWFGPGCAAVCRSDILWRDAVRFYCDTETRGLYTHVRPNFQLAAIRADDDLRGSTPCSPSYR